MSEENYELGWDDKISGNAQQERVLLADGAYNFTITKVEKLRYAGGAKMPECPQAKVFIRIDTDDGKQANLNFNLFLCKSQEWKLRSFFECIGDMKPGEDKAMNWNNLEGAHGRAHITQRKFKGNDGSDVTVNDVNKLYTYDPRFFGGIPAGLREMPADNNGDDIPF